MCIPIVERHDGVDTERSEVVWLYQPLGQEQPRQYLKGLKPTALGKVDQLPHCRD
jgi:hypothetical protein